MERMSIAGHQSSHDADNEQSFGNEASAPLEAEEANMAIYQSNDDIVNEPFYVVDLANGDRIAVKKSWVETPSSKKSRFFFSPDLNANPVFANPKHYFKKHQVDCYIGQVVRQYGRFFPFFMLNNHKKASNR